jgi:ABC-2 type transport system ATP-binding protein
MKPRDFQARLLDEPDIVDAVPEGGQVRLVSSRFRPIRARMFAGVAAQPTPARFEDGFMVLLQQAGRAKPIRPARREPAGKTRDRRLPG